ncbi:MAG: hypothetical protein N3G78_06480 [Desulfobacterota bacterium]|nr:hypothetical protein [Thermodesulfobacteriota bacterium]
MVKKHSCRFFRHAEGTHFGLGIGYCDLGVIWSICDGDVKFCETPQEMIRVFRKDWERRMERAMGNSHPW